MIVLHKHSTFDRARNFGRSCRRLPSVDISPACKGIAEECERILGSLPDWFGNKRYRSKFAAHAEAFPTLAARVGPTMVGFITVRRHFEHAFEIYCMAVHADHRRQGFGFALLESAEAMARCEGGKVMQVKTISPRHPSEAYAETRSFYVNAGYVPLEEFPLLWSKESPCLQLVKVL